MYLSSAQHDKLQIIVTNFEVPYRSYIASEFIQRFPTEKSFSDEIARRTSTSTRNANYQVVNSELGNIRANPSNYYKLLTASKKAQDDKIVSEDINVPNVSNVIALTVIFKELFSSVILRFRDENTYLEQALKYKYVRNKLDHRGCKTLETEDMVITLEFVTNIMLFFKGNDGLFWIKKYDEIIKDIQSLQSSSVTIPINIHNIYDMPFPDMKIVCRDRELQEIKEFVYGRPGALRKPSSYLLFGYGGVGKTALALEAVKQIIQDIQDGSTINDYSPEFLLFFTAKEESLDFSQTTGKLQNIPNKYSFRNSDELIDNIFSALKIPNFQNYRLPGLIIIDNIESLSATERKKVEDFIRFSSPAQVQYIVTSRNEENYEQRKTLVGFEDSCSGRDFINTYISENNYGLVLTQEEIQTLLNISMGNTLVLVLCLRRLSMNLTTISGLVADLSSPTTVRSLQQEITNIPANGYNIISEYMFKNSFEEILERYKNNHVLLATILKIFAVYPSDSLDLYTISTLSKESYSTIDPIIELLCRYLIVEKVGDNYKLNQFAEKYIIQLFMPDSESYEKLQAEIIGSIQKIQEEIKRLENDITTSKALRGIINDWSIISNGDKIAAAKAYKLYGDVKRDCSTGSAFHIYSSLEEAVKVIDSLERNTMHPYIKFQKARILQNINDTKVLKEDYSQKINQAYNDTIWTIKTNPIYNSIKRTRSYASLLWIYAINISNKDTNENNLLAIRYLEESIAVFETLKDTSNEYFSSVVLLGELYLKIYLYDRANNITYLRKARSISNSLYQSRGKYSGTAKYTATKLREELKKYGQI